MIHIPPGEITRNVRLFLREGSHDEPSRRRERSWDLCFNYFQDNPRPTQNMELSCLQLGYYLASWGMLRGSSFLFTKTNVMHYQDSIAVIEEHNEIMNGIDVDQYNDEHTLAHLDSAWYALKDSLLPEGGSSTTLISKVMMGVWGCMPSFDTFFINTMRTTAGDNKIRGLNGASNQALLALYELWKEHQEEIDQLRSDNPTWTFPHGAPGDRPLTRAKVLDIFGFQYSR